MKISSEEIPQNMFRLALITLFFFTFSTTSAQKNFPNVTISEKPALRQATSLPGKSNFFDWTTNGWAHQTVSAITYDRLGNAVNTVVSDAVTNQKTDQIQQQFDGHNNQTLLLVQAWVNNQWKNQSGYQNFYTYSPDGKIIEQIRQEWINNNWENVTKEEINYNTSQLEIEKTQSSWLNGSWNFKTKYSTTYQNGLVNEVTIQKYAGNVWQNDARFTGYTYDPASNKILSYISQNWQNNTWQDALRYSFTYSANNTTERLTEQLQNGIWENSLRVTGGHNSQGTIYTYLLEEWQNNSWQKRNEVQTIDTYNAQNQVIASLTKKWNSGTAQLENDQLYTYSDFTIIAGTKPGTTTFQAEVSPNPIQDELTITLPENRTEQVTLTLNDATGRNIKTQTLTAGLQQTRVITNNLPAGLYILKLQTPIHQQTFKLLKQ